MTDEYFIVKTLRNGTSNTSIVANASRSRLRFAFELGSVEIFYRLIKETTFTESYLAVSSGWFIYC